jgi:hypothetical protein
MVNFAYEADVCIGGVDRFAAHIGMPMPICLSIRTFLELLHVLNFTAP